MRQTTRMLLTGLLAGLLVALSGCATEPEREQRELRKADNDEQARQVEPPPPEELAKSPCGNPDWAQLPPGAEAKAPAEDEAAPGSRRKAPSDEADEADETDQTDEGDDAAEAEEESGRRSDSRLYPDRKQPCS